MVQWVSGALAAENGIIFADLYFPPFVVLPLLTMHMGEPQRQQHKPENKLVSFSRRSTPQSDVRNVL